VPQKTESNNETIKAGALLCPVCCVEYIEAEVDFDVGGEILHNVKILRCPMCQDEQFPPEQQEAFTKKEKE
jgi:hypothetical protein